MTTLALPAQSRPSPRLLSPAPLMLLLLLAVTVAAIAYGMHAVERHGAEAVAVRECIEGQGPIKIFLNPITNRQAWVCKLDEGQYGVQVRKDGSEITSFIDHQAKTWAQLIRYLERVGYDVLDALVIP